MTQRRQMLLLIPLLAAAPRLSFAKGAQSDFPSKPLKLVVPFAAGQSGDILARQLGEVAAQYLGEPIVIDNKGGAGGTIGSAIVARSKSDGYTLLLGSSGPIAIAPALYRNVGYDPNKDFTPIMNVAGTAQVLMVPINSKFKTMEDLLNAARADPSALTFGSGGTGSTAHLTMELLASRANVQMTHVPYRGAAPAYPDLIAGRIDAMFDTAIAAMPLLRSGQLRALAVSTAQRSPALPDVPTVSEAGLPGFELLAWWGIVGPAGLSNTVRDRLNKALRKVMIDESIKALLAEMGMVSLAGTPASFADFIRSEHQKFKEIILANNIEVE